MHRKPFLIPDPTVPLALQGPLVALAIIVAWLALGHWYEANGFNRGLVHYPPEEEMRLFVMGIILLPLATFGPFPWLYDWSCRVMGLVPISAKG